MLYNDLVFDLSIKEDMKYPKMKVVQGDTKSHRFIVSLKDIVQRKRVPFDLTNANLVTFTFLKEDGNSVVGQGTFTDKINGIVSYVCGTQETTFPGKVIATIEVFATGGVRLTSTRFDFKVIPQLNDGTGATSTTEYTALQQTLVNVGNVQFEEDTRKTNEIARKDNEILRIDNENIRIDNEQSRIQRMQELEGVSAVQFHERQNSFDTQLAQTTEQINTLGRGINYYWMPPLQPPARTDLQGHFINAFVGQSEDYINNYFEPMRTDFPNYVTRTLLGKDQSNQYNIYKYEFTPKNPLGTLVISGMQHGGEITNMVAMIRFLYYLLNEWEKYPDLAFIHENIRLVYIPIANPWGTNQSPRTRYNSNGVNLNRNWDYNWGSYVGDVAFTQEYKGTAPFSEKETQYIRDTILAYDDVIAYLDLHNTGSTSKDFYVALPTDYKYKTYDKLVNYFSKDMTNPVIDVSGNTRPISAGWAYTKLGLPASVPEWCDFSRGVQQYDSIEITYALAWFSNVIIEHCREFISKEPIIIDTNYVRQSANINLNVGGYAEINDFRWSMIAPYDGFVTFEGVIVLSNTDTASINYICPALGQVGTDFPYSYSTARSEVYMQGIQRMAIPFQTQIPIVRGKSLLVGIYGQTTAGTATIFRYRGRITLTPTNVKYPMQIYSATGKDGQGIGAMSKTYPT